MHRCPHLRLWSCSGPSRGKQLNLQCGLVLQVRQVIANRKGGASMGETPTLEHEGVGAMATFAVDAT